MNRGAEPNPSTHLIRFQSLKEKIRSDLHHLIIRASFSQERMTYHRETGQVEYRSKDGKETKMLHALEWLAAMCSHVPDKGEQMVRYYGCYSNVARGKRKKADADDYMKDPDYPAEVYF